MSATISPSIGAPFARILSVAGYRPERVVTNAEICERIDSTDEWIRERSGIIERRFAARDRLTDSNRGPENDISLTPIFGGDFRLHQF